MYEDLYFCHLSAEESAKPTALVGLADPDSLASQSAWPTLPVGLAYSPVASPTNVHDELSNWPSKTSSDVRADLHDWRTLLLAYLQDPSAKVDKVFGEVLSNMYCTMMSFTEEPPKTCY
jgi:hypothetical protein